MKAVQELVQVELREGRPSSLFWRERRYSVSAIQDAWRFGGRWWLGEPPRDCFLVQAGPLTAELHHEAREGGRWWLARLED